MAEARAAIHRSGPGCGDPPLFRQGGTASGVLRNRKTATRTGKGEEYETHYTAKFWKTPHPQAAATEYYPLTDDDGGELSAGVRPAPLEEGRPQGKLQRHAGIGYEIGQGLDACAAGGGTANIVQFFAMQLPVVAEPVIEVPKILPDRVPQRIVERRPPHIAEQFMDVPTVVSYSSLQQLIAEPIIDIPIPGRGGELVFKVFTVNRVLQRCWSRSPKLLIQVEVFKILSQSRVPQRPARFLLDTLVRVFRIFPRVKKSRSLP